jgi:hypothetical protein
VPGAAHTYPAQTTISIVHGGCGWNARWDALEERWDADEICEHADGAPTLRTRTSYHEFLGRGETEEFVCDAGAYVRPPSDTPGSSSDARCASTATQAAARSVVVGLEQVTVGGVVVDAVHDRTDTTISGKTRGTRRTERWLRRTDGLLLRLVASTQAETDTSGGTIGYREDYELRLTELEPRQ